MNISSLLSDCKEYIAQKESEESWGGYGNPEGRGTKLLKALMSECEHYVENKNALVHILTQLSECDEDDLEFLDITADDLKRASKALI